jgi:hypothetical protein
MATFVCLSPRALHAVTNPTMEARSCFCLAYGGNSSHPLCGWSLIPKEMPPVGATGLPQKEHVLDKYLKEISVLDEKSLYKNAGILYKARAF